MMDMNKHIATNDPSKPFHNNVYAKVANGERFGSTSDISFQQRRQIEKSRNLVQDYQRSAIGNAYSVLRSKPVNKDTIGKTNVPQRPNLQTNTLGNSTSISSQGLGKPQRRGYDPFA